MLHPAWLFCDTKGETQSAKDDCSGWVCLHSGGLWSPCISVHNYCCQATTWSDRDDCGVRHKDTLTDAHSFNSVRINMQPPPLIPCLPPPFFCFRAFFWLLSLFFSSVVWIIVPPLRYEPAFTLPFSVLFQEAFRWLFYKLIRCSESY